MGGQLVRVLGQQLLSHDYFSFHIEQMVKKGGWKGRGREYRGTLRH